MYSSLVQKSAVETKRRSCQSKPVLESYLELLHEGAFADVTFTVGPQKERIPCHQLFLKTRSPVFEVMFSERWNQDEEVPLEDVDPNVFKKFLQYIYADTFEVNVPEALELLQIAHIYDVQLLVGMCEKLLESEVTLDAAVDVFQVARDYEMIRLMDRAGDLIAISFAQLQNLPSFSRVDKETLMYILERSDLKMKEIDIFRLALQWAKNQSHLTVQQSLEDILPLIRFPLMTLEDFTTTVVPTELLSQSALIDLFMYFGTNPVTRRSLTSELEFSTKWRQSPEANVSCVSLYSGEFAESKIRRQKYMQLSECLQFAVDIVCDSFLVSSPTRPSPLAEMRDHKTVGLHGLDFYCPPTTKEINGRNVASALTKEFKVILKGKSEFDSFWQPIHDLSSVKCREGKMTEVEFDPAIPFESGLQFYIEIADITNEGKVVLAQDYEFREFGEIRPRITKAFEDKSVEIGNFHKFHLGHLLFGENLIMKPQLIYNLRLKEW